MCLVFLFCLIGFLVAWACGSIVMTVIFAVGVLVLIIATAIFAFREKKDLDKSMQSDNREKRKAKKVHKEKVVAHVEKDQKLPVDLSLIRYVPEEKLPVIVNNLTLKYGISAAVIWAAIRKERKDMPMIDKEDKVYWEDFYGDDRERDVYLNDFEPDELDEDERDELLEDLDMVDHDDWDLDDDSDYHDSSDSWHSDDSFDSHDDFGHDSFGGHNEYDSED